ncbi:MAG: ferrous iron transport protein A [Pirellulaceae bacterium]
MIAGCSGNVLPLDQLRTNEFGSIADLSGEGAEIQRLAELGLCVGADVRMLRPGKPCLLALGGKRLSVRLSEGVDVFVSMMEKLTP